MRFFKTLIWLIDYRYFAKVKLRKLIKELVEKPCGGEKGTSVVLYY